MARIENPPNLQTILGNLKTVANGIRTSETSCADMHGQLKACGYRSSSDVSKNQEIVMKLFAVAVNEAIQKKVNLSLLDNEEEETKLYSLLGIDENKELSDYFSPTPKFKGDIKTWLGKAKSPLDIAVGLKKGVSQEFAKNLIERQYKISWNEMNVKTSDYTFYQFCEEQKSREFLHHIPRKAWTLATLYRERMSDKFLELCDCPKKRLCPEVFIKTSQGWKIWNAERNTFQIPENKNYLSWIDRHIMTFIEENADIHESDYDSLKKALKTPTLYWAVLDDEDFKAGGKLKLNKIGRTQVYVGKAIKGIRGRWTNDGKNHCTMMKKCLNDVNAMTTYEPRILKGIQLVDARLALAKVRKKHSALFLIKTFMDDVEEAEIVKQKAQNAFKASEVGSKERIWRKKKLDKATENLKLVEKTAKKKEERKEIVKQKLEAAEKQHLIGKKHNFKNRNIIPSKYKIKEWSPKNMAYGMNEIG